MKLKSLNLVKIDTSINNLKRWNFPDNLDFQG